ncbi:MAG: UPF0182 family protein [Myxococcota bacterium]
MRSRFTLWFVIAAAVLLFGGGQAIATLVTDAQWFATLGHFQVFQTQLVTQIGLGLVGGLVTFLIVGGSAGFAARHAGPPPRPRAVGPEDDNPFAAALQGVSPRTIATVISLAIALLAGLTVAGWWEHLLLLINGQPFGIVDPVWQLDASFYVFDLPFILRVQQALSLLLSVAVVVTFGLYVTRGVVSLELAQQDGQVVANGINLPAEVRRHLATLIAGVLVLWAIGTFLQRFELMYDQAGLFAGPGYAELNGTLPLLTVQAVATVLAAVVAFIGVDRGALGTVTLAGLLIGGTSLLTSAYPSVLQRFSVDPNELSREGPQIVDHIEATRHAFNLDGIDELTLSGKDELDRTDIDQNEGTIVNIRLWDHQPLLDTFSQVQEIRTYYGFMNVDNDRYEIDGQLRQIMLSPRELTVQELPEQARTWVNETMTYTHGYGLALGPVNRVNAQGLPELFIQDLPPKVQHTDTLAIDQAAIYFGETPDALRKTVVVKSANPEFDYPVGNRNEYTTYTGEAGVPLSGLARLLFSMRLGSTDLLFSGDITHESRLLLYRHVVARAARVAPFLRYDSDPYMVIDQGRLVWILDAYTTSAQFPYAASVGGGNYIRNAVKVTVDAYDGTVTFYGFDMEDPILAAWSLIFPDLFTPIETMPESLRAHLRYPSDLFREQARLFATYHMVDHQIFYNREDEWEVPAIGSKGRMEPYYTIMRLPGESTEEFIVMLPFSPRGKPNLAAWMVAQSDGENLGRLRVYQFPKDTLVYGPKMVAARIQQDPEISQNISLWDQQGSAVNLGTLLVIPIEESLIYVQPLYLQAKDDSIPELKRVIVAYKDQIAMQPTLEEGLAELFGEVEAVPVEVPDAAQDGSAPPLVLDATTRAALIEQAQQQFEAASELLNALGETLEALKDEPAQ